MRLGAEVLTDDDNDEVDEVWMVVWMVVWMEHKPYGQKQKEDL